MWCSWKDRVGSRLPTKFLFLGKHGLTLLETMLALIMLSLLIVGVLGLLGSLLVASTKSTDTTAGSFVGQYLFSEAAVNGPPKDGSMVEEGIEELLSHEEDIPVKFHYRINWTLLAPAKTYAGGGPGGRKKVQFGPDLYLVEVTVWWMVENPEDGRIEGGGRRTVSLERLISFEPQPLEK